MCKKCLNHWCPQSARNLWCSIVWKKASWGLVAKHIVILMGCWFGENLEMISEHGYLLSIWNIILQSSDDMKFDIMFQGWEINFALSIYGIHHVLLKLVVGKILQNYKSWLITEHIASCDMNSTPASPAFTKTTHNSIVGCLAKSFLWIVTGNWYNLTMTKKCIEPMYRHTYSILYQTAANKIQLELICSLFQNVI